MSDLLDNFIDGVLGTPTSIANGISNILGTAGLNTRNETHISHFSDFLIFAKNAAFDGAIHRITEIIAVYIINKYPNNAARFAANAAAKAGGTTITKAAVASALASKMSTGASKAATAVAARAGVRSILLVLTVADYAGQSGAAADRLKEALPDLYVLLKNEGLIGGYFLVEPYAAEMQRKISES